MRTLHERIAWMQSHCGSGELSLAEIAEKAEVSRQALSALVRRSKADPEKDYGKGATLEKIASAWNVDFVWLVTGKGAPRRGKLSALDTVLSEREWSPAAQTAARAEKRELSADGWRQLLGALETAFAAAGARGDTKKQPRSRSK